MAAKAKAPKEKNKTDEPQGLLVETAKALGSVAGKVASAVGLGTHNAEAPPPPPEPRHKGKLQPKNKSRLPRRQKKALKKSTAASKQQGS
jgi:hypothetical protein